MWAVPGRHEGVHASVHRVFSALRLYSDSASRQVPGLHALLLGLTIAAGTPHGQPGVPGYPRVVDIPAYTDLCAVTIARGECSMPTPDELLAIALRHHQAGSLRQAEDTYRQIIQAEPRN